jgi:hypothetical protein
MYQCFCSEKTIENADICSDYFDEQTKATALSTSVSILITAVNIIVRTINIKLIDYIGQDY